MKILIFIIYGAVVCCSDDNNLTDFRKHYGLSFNGGCSEYTKVFKCMAQCKSIGYQIYRLNRNCKCFCHEMKTSTVLPYFKWRTNTTAKNRPSTFSPRLYDVVGTLSPPPTETIIPTTDFTCPPVGVYPGGPPGGNDTASNTTDAGGNSTDADGSGGDPTAIPEPGGEDTTPNT